MELDSRSGAARQAVTAAGVTGAALLLTLAAAVPALAGTAGDGPQGASAAHRADGAHSQAQAHRGSSDDADTHATNADEAETDDPDTAGTDTDADGDDATKGDHGRRATGAEPATGAPTGHNPPGNNGTVFIHDVAGDSSPHNAPHVPCTFYADFFGFDLDQQVTVSFAGQAPTGMGTPLLGSWTGTVSDDDAGGAGQDFDLELPFSADTLGVTSLGDPHPQQGYHVKMTVQTNEPGGKKSKVFWIAPCAGTTAALGTTVAGEDVATGGTATGTTIDETSGSLVEGGSVSGADVAMANRPQTVVIGEHFTRSPAGESAAAASLPFTGAEIGSLLAMGAAAVGGGVALAVAGRRRRTASVSSTG
jgi:hypothetical protein